MHTTWPNSLSVWSRPLVCLSGGHALLGKAQRTRHLVKTANLAQKPGMKVQHGCVSVQSPWPRLQKGLKAQEELDGWNKPEIQKPRKPGQGCPVRGHKNEKRLCCPLPSWEPSPRLESCVELEGGEGGVVVEGGTGDMEGVGGGGGWHRTADLTKEWTAHPQPRLLDLESGTYTLTSDDWTESQRGWSEAWAGLTRLAQELHTWESIVTEEPWVVNWPSLQECSACPEYAWLTSGWTNSCTKGDFWFSEREALSRSPPIRLPPTSSQFPTSACWYNMPPLCCPCGGGHVSQTASAGTARVHRKQPWVPVGVCDRPSCPPAKHWRLSEGESLLPKNLCTCAPGGTRKHDRNLLIEAAHLELLTGRLLEPLTQMDLKIPWLIGLWPLVPKELLKLVKMPQLNQWCKGHLAQERCQLLCHCSAHLK